ncbi:MAG: universal stress protein [Acidimicrobiales bacterium]
MRILVAVDGSDATTRVAQFVNTFFTAPDHEVLAINVAADPTAPPPLGWGAPYPWVYPIAAGPVAPMTDADEVLQRTRDEAEATVQRSGVDGDATLTAHGDAAEAILQAGEDRRVDLIVVGSNHKRWLDRLWSPSVSSGVIKHSDRPVLVVP